MNSNKLLVPIFGGIVILCSCSPYREDPIPAPSAPEDPALNVKKSITDQPQKEIKKKRKTVSSEVKKATKPKSTTSSSTASSKPKPKPKKKVYPKATPVPGKDGYVFSPYNNKVINVGGIPSGQLVKDPEDPAEAKRFFLVP